MKQRKKSSLLNTIKVAGAIAIGSGVLYAQSLKDDVEKIRDYVIKNPTSYSISQNNSQDTTFICGEDFYDASLEIRVSKETTCLYDEGIFSRQYYFDYGNDGNLDRLISIYGVIGAREKAQIEDDGLNVTCDYLEKNLNLNSEIQKKEGKTPYNSRKVFVVNYRDNSVTIYDFSEGKIEKDIYTSRQLNNLYYAILRESKLLLGIKE